MQSHDDPELERQQQIAYGEDILRKQGIDPSLYEDCFPIMAENDVPLVNSMPTEMFISDEKDLDDAERSLNFLLTRYNSIDLSKQNEKTGKDIIEEMKKLLSDFDQAFKSYAQQARKTGNFAFPGQLTDLKRRIMDLGERYTNEVPAYKAYRWVGRFKLDPEGRRGFQIARDEAD